MLVLNFMLCNYCSVPKGVPIGVKAVYYNATAAIVEWIPVNDTRDVMKGVLLGYRVCSILKCKD